MILTYNVIDNTYFNVKDVLKTHFKISNKLLAFLKNNKLIFLNNIPVYVTTQIKIGDIIKVDLSYKEDSENIIPINKKLDILYEDDSMLIVNKEPNIPIHPSINHFEDTLSNAVKYYFEKNNIYKKIRPVNRLDKDTSGIVIFAKNEYIQELLIKQMSTSFKKEYIAILTGFLDDNIGTINVPISRKSNSIIEREPNNNGETAITHYKLIKTFSVENMNLSLVRFTLETGRTHQIRVHSKYIGHPILEDSLYGEKSNLISRQALHAEKITFNHPIKNKLIEIISPLPNDMEVLIK